MNNIVNAALYIDLDNIETRIRQSCPEAADAFLSSPARWMRWLEGHAVKMLYGEDTRRRIILKRLYFNPHKYGKHQNTFLVAGFDTISCPVMTMRGKTSADMRMTVDAMCDALAPQTTLHEAIILSGDVDFLPLLTRLHTFGMATLHLSVGEVSSYLAAAPGWRIREDWFIAQALLQKNERSDNEASGNK